VGGGKNPNDKRQIFPITIRGKRGGASRHAALGHVKTENKKCQFDTNASIC